MSDRDEGFLARWSRRKTEARHAPDGEEKNAAAPAVEPAGEGGVVPPSYGAQEVPALPPIESLTPESDFAPFMRSGVDPGVKGQALKALFSDPALYAMDGLDVYIDDYTQPDPLPEGWLRKLNQLASLHGEPEATGPQGRETADEPGADPSHASASAAQPSEADRVDTSVASEAQPQSKNRGAI